MPPRGELTDYVRIGATVALVVAAFARPQSVDGSLALQQAEAIVVDGTLAIDQVLIRQGALDAARGEHGRFPKPSLAQPAPHDGQAVDRSWSEGHFYPGKSPGLSLLAVPATWLFFNVVAPSVPATVDHADVRSGVMSLLFTLTTIVPLSVATVLVVHRFHLRLGIARRGALLLSLTYALGTMAFFYGTSPNPWQVINAITWALLLAFVHSSPASLRKTGLLGLLAGSVVVLHYSAALLIPIFVVFVLAVHGAKRASVFALGSAIGVAVLLAYNAAVFGEPLVTAYARRVDAIGPALAGGVMGYSWPSPVIASWLLFGLRRGLFLYMPVSLVALLARRRGALGEPTFWLAVSGAGLYLLLNAGRHYDWHAGQGFFGPRYLLPALPFLWLLIVDGSSRLGDWALQRIAAVSIFISWIGAQWGESFLASGLGLFLLRGPYFPVIGWLDGVRAYFGQGRTPFSSLGVLTVLILVLISIWADFGRATRSDPESG